MQRKCLLCGSNTTYWNSFNKNFHWYKYKTGYICGKCHSGMSQVSCNILGKHISLYTKGSKEEFKEIVKKTKDDILNRFINDKDYRKKIMEDVECGLEK